MLIKEKRMEICSINTVQFGSLVGLNPDKGYLFVDCEKKFRVEEIWENSGQLTVKLKPGKNLTKPIDHFVHKY